MSDKYVGLVSRIFEAMAEDDYDQSERLATTYGAADAAGKELLDEAFTCLCGWRLCTLMEQAAATDLAALR